MQFVADLHLHSKYSRAVSQDMVLPIMATWGKKKGIDILSASDWTHSLWFKELKSQLTEASEGLYRLKSSSSIKATEDKQKEPLFLLSTEIASIYSQNGKLRRIHNLVFAPSFDVAEKINKELMRRGCNLLSDGRPIVGLSSKDLLDIVLNIDRRVVFIPCHIWTPHFGIYGSASGFDSLDEAFGDLSSYVYGIETGLSSDPEMNWEVRELQGKSILSFSDAHSPAKMGREATVFVYKNGPPAGGSNQQITYDDIAAAIKRDPKGNLKVGYTIEFYPEEGKYHFSGHRNCGVVFGPDEIRSQGDICPKCKRRLTEGVLFRVQQLADKRFLNLVEEKKSPHGIKWYTDKTKVHPPYVKLVPLNEIIAEAFGMGVSSQKTKSMFDTLCLTLGSEIAILLKTPVEEISKIGGAKIAEAVEKVRSGTIVVDPGFDGEYGKVKIWDDESQKSPIRQAQGKSQNLEGRKEEAQLELF